MEADQIVVPANTIKKHLQSRALPLKNPIIHISNGAEIPQFPSNFRPPISGPYLIYFGALQPWQGVDDLLRAFRLLRDFDELKLVICSSNKKQQVKPFHKLAVKLEIDERVIWNYQLPKPEIYDWIKGAEALRCSFEDGQTEFIARVLPL